MEQILYKGRKTVLLCFDAVGFSSICTCMLHIYVFALHTEVVHIYSKCVDVESVEST
jgi:hypothetical protein